MQSIHFIFDYKKATQALNYLAQQEGGKINKMKALKLIYFADRYHLRKYGRLITNDNYFAMEHGPVPSVTKDIAESNDYLAEDKKSYSSIYIKPVSNLELKSVKKIDKKVFSKSDLEALRFAWDKFGNYDQYQLRDITHSYPEWARWKNLAVAGSCLPIDILDFLKDPIEDVDESLNLDPIDHQTFVLKGKQRAVRSETLTERSLIESLWR